MGIEEEACATTPRKKFRLVRSLNLYTNVFCSTRSIFFCSIQSPSWKSCCLTANMSKLKIALLLSGRFYVFKPSSSKTYMHTTCVYKCYLYTCAHSPRNELVNPATEPHCTICCAPLHQRLHDLIQRPFLRVIHRPPFALRSFFFFFFFLLALSLFAFVKTMGPDANADIPSSSIIKKASRYVEYLTKMLQQRLHLHSHVHIFT
jgi:hypothetical protein